MVPKLIILTEDGTRRGIKLPPDRVLKVGRGRGADIRVRARFVSKEHCTVIHDGRECTLTDAGSQNGTLVNGRRVKSTELRDGDVVRIGLVDLKFKWPSTAAQASSEDNSADVPSGPVLPFLAEDYGADLASELSVPSDSSSDNAASPSHEAKADPPPDAQDQCANAQNGAPRWEPRSEPPTFQPASPPDLPEDESEERCPVCGETGHPMSFHYDRVADHLGKKRKRNRLYVAAASALIGLGMGWLCTLSHSRDVTAADDPRLYEGEEVSAEAARLGDGEAGKRIAAITEFVKRGNASVQTLARAINANNRNVRLGALYALGRIGTPESGDALLKATKHGDPEVRYHVMDALETMREKRAAPLLLEALEDEAAPVRAKAAAVLGVVGDRGVLDALRRTVADPDTRTRMHAIRSMEKITGQRLFVTKKQGKIVIRPARESDPQPPGWQWNEMDT